MKANLYSYTLAELEAYFKNLGEPKFRAKQVYDWLYKNRVSRIQEMTNLSKSLRDQLEQDFDLQVLEIDTYQVSKDGTVKFLFKLRDGHFIESVLMEHNYGNSVCVTTQVGCKMGCTFCASTLGGVERNLDAGEIVAQVVMIQKYLDAQNERVSSVVIMGSGEPFDNFDHTMKFIDLINSEAGLNIGARHITVSTCGIVPKIYEFADRNHQVTLAISLHATENAVRSVIMPINRAYNLEMLLEAMEYYTKKTNRRISIEFGLLNGINDTQEEAERLAQLVKHLNCHINIIPINYVLERGYQTPSTEKITAFVNVLAKHGIPATVRRKKGDDIDAACGQLRAKRAKLL